MIHRRTTKSFYNIHLEYRSLSQSVSVSKEREMRNLLRKYGKQTNEVGFDIQAKLTEHPS